MIILATIFGACLFYFICKPIKNEFLKLLIFLILTMGFLSICIEVLYNKDRSKNVK